MTSAVPVVTGSDRVKVQLSLLSLRPRSDLGNGRLWTLGTSSSAWFTRGDANLDPTRITHLIPLVADAEGNLSTDEGRDVVALSSALNPRFSCLRRSSRPPQSSPAPSSSTSPPATSPTSTRWPTETPGGVMERTAAGIKPLSGYGNEEEEDTFVGGIYRYNLYGSLHSKLYTGYLEDATTFTVNYWSNDDKRWFAHGEEAPYNVDGVTPRIPGLTEEEWILSCAADYYNGSGASTTSCAVCSLVSALWSFF